MKDLRREFSQSTETEKKPQEARTPLFINANKIQVPTKWSPPAFDQSETKYQ